MIPTRYKSKLSKLLSWPVGAEAVTAGLAGAPHAADLSLWFSDSPDRPASAFQRLMRGSLPYPVLIAEYRPASRPGYGGAGFLVEGGWYEAKWQVHVYPVLRPVRAAAAAVLKAEGLPAVAAWLRSSGRAGWESISHRIELVFAPADGTLAARLTDGA